jgi:hypothetical protein
MLPLPVDPPPPAVNTPQNPVTVTVEAGPAAGLAPAPPEGPPPTVMFAGAGQEGVVAGPPAQAAADEQGGAGEPAVAGPAAVISFKQQEAAAAPARPKVSPAVGWGVALGGLACVLLTTAACAGLARLQASLVSMAEALSAASVGQAHGLPGKDEATAAAGRGRIKLAAVWKGLWMPPVHEDATAEERAIAEEGGAGVL